MLKTTNQRLKDSRLAAWIFGPLLLLYLMAVAFIFPEPTVGQIPLFRFFMALLSAFFAYFFVGWIGLRGRLYGQQIMAGGGFALFLLIEVIYNPFTIRTVAGDYLPKAVISDPKIKHVQEELKQIGLLDKSPDGVRDTPTNNAIKQFQAQNHLMPNGILAPEVISALDSASPSAPSSPMNGINAVGSATPSIGSNPPNADGHDQGDRGLKPPPMAASVGDIADFYKAMVDSNSGQPAFLPFAVFAQQRERIPPSSPTPVASALEVKTRRIARLLGAGKFDAVYAELSAALQQEFPPGQLSEVWNTLIAKLGRFRQIESVDTSHVGSCTIVYVQCTCGKTPVSVCAAYDQSNRLVSLWIEQDDDTK